MWECSVVVVAAVEAVSYRRWMLYENNSHSDPPNAQTFRPSDTPVRFSFCEIIFASFTKRNSLLCILLDGEKGNGELARETFLQHKKYVLFVLN